MRIAAPDSSCCLYASWLMRLPSFCALIAGAMFRPRLPALLGACQFLMAHVLPHALFEKKNELPCGKLSTAKTNQVLPTASYFCVS
jgi:hypothetical protein